MIRTEREKTREVRKLNVLKAFVGNEILYTNQIAKKIGVVWPVADRLLQELVDEGRLSGDKLAGYTPYKPPVKLTLYERIKRFIHV